MIKTLFSWLRALGEGGFFGGGATAPHGHTGVADGGTLLAANLPGTRTFSATPCVKNPYAVGTVTSQAHGLARKPDGHKVILECLTADLNYSPGDCIDLSSTNSGVGGGTGYSIFSDATNTQIMIMTGGSISIGNKTTAAGTAITAANWKITATGYINN